VVLNLPHGIGPFVNLRLSLVTVTNRVDSAPFSFNYSAPSISGVLPSPFDARGSQRLSIYGDNLGLVGLGPRPVVHVNGGAPPRPSLISPSPPSPRGVRLPAPPSTLVLAVVVALCGC
jgi:hypothetical protein